MRCLLSAPNMLRVAAIYFVFSVVKLTDCIPSILLVVYSRCIYCICALMMSLRATLCVRWYFFPASPDGNYMRAALSCCSGFMSRDAVYIRLLYVVCCRRHRQTRHLQYGKRRWHFKSKGCSISIRAARVGLSEVYTISIIRQHLP